MLSTETVDNLISLIGKFGIPPFFIYNPRYYSYLRAIVPRNIERMHLITIQRNVPKQEMPAAVQLKQWAQKALQGKSLDIEMTIRVVNMEEMTELNTHYRHKTGATNVLSFPYDMPADITDEPQLLGDIVICAAVVNKEAQEQKKSFDAHWAHMVVHGTLHLLGYDHEIPEDADAMESLEITILKTLGFPNPYQ